MDFEIDNLTVLLLAALAFLALYTRFFGPSSLVHPLLLGQQAAASSVRQPGESAVYRSWATGQGTPFQVRPANQLKTVNDVVKVPMPQPKGGVAAPLTQRYILDTPLTSEALTEIVRLVPLGLRALFPTLIGTPAAPKPVLTMLPPSPSSQLPLLLLSLASTPSSPLVVVPSPDLFDRAITNTEHPTPAILVVHESKFDEVIDQSLDYLKQGDFGILVVGDPKKRWANVASSAEKHGIIVHWWEELWDAAEKLDTAAGAQGPAEEPVAYSDVHSYFYSLPLKNATSSPVVKATHMNFTAGIAGLLSLFPADKRPTSGLNDVVGSAIRLDTPFGMTIALAAVWSGAGFRLIGPAQPTWDFDAQRGIDELASELVALTTGNQPFPTILFLTPQFHAALLIHLHDAYVSHPFSRIATAHTLRDLRAGYISRSSILNRIVGGVIRDTVLGGIAGSALRAAIVVSIGGTSPSPAMPANALPLSHVLLGLPLSRVHSSPVSAGPLFTSHFYDLQSTIVPDVEALQKRRIVLGGKDRVHSGPPSANVEVMLRGDTDADVSTEGKENGEELSGRLFVRGPAVLDVLDEADEKLGWVNTGDYASVAPNGTFTWRDAPTAAHEQVVKGEKEPVMEKPGQEY